MTKSEKIILIASIVMLLAGAGIFFYKKGSGSSSNDLLRIDLSSFRESGGWGYDIKVVGGNYSIHQDRIPGIAGNEAFISEEEALKAGGLVVERMKHKKPPMLTIKDLKNLGIHF